MGGYKVEDNANEQQTSIGVPRCVECNRLYKKSEVNERSLCPKCIDEKIHEMKADALSSENELKNEQLVDTLSIKPEEKKAKPGQVIREAFLRLVVDGKITPFVLSVLVDKEATSKDIGIRYAFLREFDSSAPIQELTYVKGHARYSSKPVVIGEGQYLITNDLYKTTVPKFFKWVETLSKDIENVQS